MASKGRSRRERECRRADAARQARARATRAADQDAGRAQQRGPVGTDGDFVGRGQLAKQARLANELLRADPDDAEAQQLYASALQAMHERQSRSAGDGAGARRSGAGRAGGGSGRAVGPEGRLLAAFDDRSVLYRLDRAVLAWLDGSLLGDMVEEYVEEWLELATPELEGGAPDSASEPTPRAHDPAAERMALEHALLMGEGDDEEPVLALFAAAAAAGAAPRLAAAARSWLRHVHYGLWQVSDPRPGPGVWLTDLVSATRRYAQLSPDQAEALLPWSVLAGALVPIEGVWRVTGGFARLVPDEGDAFCAAIGALGQELGLLPNGRRRPTSLEGPESCFGVLVGEREPLDADATRALSAVIGCMLPRMLAALASARREPARLSNTDGEPLLLISAELGVADVDRAWARLCLHPDVEPDGDEELLWWGHDVGAAQRAMMRASLESELGGFDAAELDGEMPRWLRGRVRRDAAHLVLEVNSEARLDAFLDLLGTLGEISTVLGQARVDPSLDLRFPNGRLHPMPMDDGVRRAWAASWLDESLPTLGGLTPRQAAADELRWIDLEALLRKLEHDAALSGEDDDWIDRLRQELHLGAMASAAVTWRRARGA